MRLLLASHSPRRRQLLAQLGFPIDYVSLEVDEHVSPSLPADEVAGVLARRKADAFDSAKLGTDEVLVTADTVVVHRGHVMGKPADRAEAIAMLHELAGEGHTVYTGVCLCSRSAVEVFTESTKVFFRQLADKDIEYYVDHYQSYDKAGSYGIQEWIGMVGVERIEGCYYNVMGLPVARLYERLSRMSASM